MKIGLYFGTFDPMHIGHLSIINYMVSFTDLDQLWVIPSRQNPFKKSESLIRAKSRFNKIRARLKGFKNVKVLEVEIKLPAPSYSVTTLEVLKRKYPKHKYILVMGGDNLESFFKWRAWRRILKSHLIYVYPRSGSRRSRLWRNRRVKVIEAPRVDISSTFIREGMKKGKDMSLYLA